MAHFSNSKYKIKTPENFKLTGGTIWILEKIYRTAPLEKKLNHLRSLDIDTVGYGVSQLLDERNYRLIPKFENHDLKHLILGYEMTMQDEIKMQAYLIGNGNYTLPCLLFFSLFLFYPSTWKSLPGEYRNGKSMKSIYFLTLDECKGENLAKIRREYSFKFRNNNTTNGIDCSP
ncbi:hypothetical protein [Flavobacterium sp. 3HN19-14]|uniref:hypothetical protein n=1 Tax=Flavobacterium sp. 3HN19-14 TaxID=3448133 RepID=UPI003EE0C052